MMLVNMKEGGFISAYDYEIGLAIARVMCGGEVESGSLVDERWLLDLERAEFMKLLAAREDAGADRAHARDRQAVAQLEVRTMSRQLQDAYIVAATRTAVGKAPRGVLRTTRPDTLLAHVLRSVTAQGSVAAAATGSRT